MDWQGLSRQLLAEHQHEPQTLGRLELALKMAQEALQLMAGHGHVYHLAEGPGEKLPEWPRKLYHVDSSPNGIIIYSEEEAIALGPGWFDSFQKAQFWDGLETQFNGRGGVAKSPRVPAPIFAMQTTSDPEADESRRAFVSAFRLLNKWERPNALELTQTTQPDGSGGEQSELRKSDRDSDESREGLRSGGQSQREVRAEGPSEQEAFSKQVKNFGQQKKVG